MKKIIVAGLYVMLLSFSLQNADAAQMADYCYLPPFVTDSNTPPNIMLVFEKGSAILKRSYSTSYNPDRSYYGFFQSNAYYTYDTTNNYFYKNSCTPSTTGLNCISGNMLNWALMSNIDLARKVLVGFGWPEPGAGSGAGDVFTYSGDFCSSWSGTTCANANIAPVSYGQWEDGNSTNVNAVVSIGGGDYYYTFCLSKFSGSNPTGLGVKVKSGSAASCGGPSNALFTGGKAAMKFTDESRVGLIQKYADKDKDYLYDTDGARFGIRRWNTGTDKQTDLPAAGLSTADQQNLFKAVLNSVSKAPPEDPQTPYLDSMMKDIVNYFQGVGGLTYNDNASFTQTPLDWSADTARKCRKSFVLFITTGDAIEDPGSAPLTTSCSSGTASSDFSQNTCYGYTTDLYSGDGNPPKQTLLTYIVQTKFDASSTGAANASKLQYASAGVGGGQYYSIDDPTTFESQLEAAILNIISASASASTVATLTSQTREASTLTQAYFYPQVKDTALRWIGNLRLLWSDPGANIREDTANTAWLDLKKDNILSFFFDSTDIAYKARAYKPSENSPYLLINSCDPNASGNSTYTNDNIGKIWNAPDVLENRPDDRNIKIGLGDSAGIISSATAAASFLDFTTSLNTVLQPFWNTGGYCSNNVSRWCAANTACNYCAANPTRFCPAGTNAECNYCSLNAQIGCSADPDCVISYGTCNLSTLVCADDATRACASDAGCVDNYGACTTTDACTTTAVCNAECNNDCATSVIKFVRGYDKPTPSGGDFRVRHKCTVATQAADCPGGMTCGADNTCSGPDNLKTLKLGDIVFSTPRISSNTYLNGYTLINKDETYKTFIENTMKNTTPIVLAGANDGMVHAFQVSKIKDLNPATTTGGGVTDGYQIAMFADNILTDTTPPTDLGKELWAYIPYNTVPFLKWYCAKGYCHIPMVDARFVLVDASINAASATATKAANGADWRRLLIGSMGIGGKQITIGNAGDGTLKTLSSSIFVIDITDPLSPQLLWEKPLPDRTLTTSAPAVVRLASAATELSKNEAGNWYVVYGSGPQSVLTNGVTYKSDAPNIYVFNLKTGDLSATIPITGASGVAVGDFMSVDMDSDYQVDDLYFGTYGGTGASQTGNLYRLRMRNDASYYTPAQWALSTVIDFTGGNVARPIFASPEVAQDSSGNVWIYFGTGLYLTVEHAKSTTDDEYLYGFKESKDCWKGTGSCSPYSSLFDATSATFINAKAVELGCFCGGVQMSTLMCDPPGTCAGSCGANKACTNNLLKTCSVAADCPGGTCIENKVVLKVDGATLSGSGACDGRTGDDAIGCLENDVIKTMNGWKRAVNGQKMFAKPFVAGGLVDFTSFQPQSDSCSLGGTTYLISVQYTTGTPYAQPTIALADVTTGGYGNLTINPSVKLGTGVPPLGESLVALPLAGDAFKVITQVSGGLPGITMAPSLGATSGYVHWRTR